jgi:plasmid stabilization system protein ParE
MAFHVETTAAAEQDADAILDWLLSQRAGDTGFRWFLALQDAIASLATMGFPGTTTTLSTRSKRLPGSAVPLKSLDAERN